METLLGWTQGLNLRTTSLVSADVWGLEMLKKQAKISVERNTLNSDKISVEVLFQTNYYVFLQYSFCFVYSSVLSDKFHP